MKLWPFSRKDSGFTPVVNTYQLFNELFGGKATKSGASVTSSTALEVTTVLDCVRVIAEGIAQVPLNIYQKTGRNRDILDTHPLHYLLHTKPNGWQSSFEMRESLAIRAALNGNAFAATPRSSTGEVMEIVPLLCGSVVPKQRTDYTMEYEVTPPSGDRRTLSAEQIWHWRGPSWNGIVGMDVMNLAREAIGLAMVTESAHSKLHASGARIAGTYSVEGTLTAPQNKDLRDWLNKEYAGPENANKIMILDRAAKFLPQSQTGVDSQHLETRRYQVEEVCRAFRVLPIMVGYSDKASTYASAEQMFLAHIVHTLAPWYTRIEQSIAVQMLRERDLKAGIYAKFNAAGLARGAMKDTSDYLTKMVAGKIMSTNEAREKLELNPVDGGDEVEYAGNLAPDTPADDSSDPTPKDGEKDDT